MAMAIANACAPLHANPSMTDQPAVHPSSNARLGPDGQTGGWITRPRRVIRHGDGNRLNRSQPLHADPSMTDQPTVHPSSATRLGLDGQTGGWITRRRRVIRHGDGNRPISGPRQCRTFSQWSLNLRLSIFRWASPTILPGSFGRQRRRRHTTLSFPPAPYR